MNRFRQQVVLITIGMLLWCGWCQAQGVLVSGEVFSGSVPAGEAVAHVINGTAGGVLEVIVGDTTGISHWPELVVQAPDGTELGRNFNSSSARVLVAPLPQTGQYTIWVGEHNGAVIQSYNVCAMVAPGNTNSQNDPDLGGMSPAETKYGTLAQGDIDGLSFQADVGDTVVLWLARLAAGPEVILELFGPNGQLLASSQGNTETWLRVRNLPLRGTYYVFCRLHQPEQTTNYSLSFLKMPGALTSVLDPDGGQLNNPDSRDGTTMFGDLDVYSFAANQGDRMAATLSCGGMANSPWLDLYAPDGTLLLERAGNNNLAQMELDPLPQTGTYYLVARDQFATKSHAYSLNFQMFPRRAMNVQIIPRHTARNVSPDVVILVTFQRPMNPNFTGGWLQSFPAAGSAGAQAFPSLQWNWLSDTQVQVRPTGRLQFNTRHQMVIAKNSKDADGFEIGEDKLAEFTTSPTLITGAAPAHGSAGASRWAAPVISFRWPVVMGSAESHFQMTNGSGDPVAGVFEWLKPFSRVRFRPTQPLPANQSCTVTLTSGIALKDGRRITWPESVIFTVANQPVVTACSPQGDAVPVGSLIRVTFDQAMHRASVQNNFSMVPNTPGAFSWVGRQLTFTPNAPLQPGTQYRVVVGNRARSSLGEAMGRNHVWRFTTAAGAAGLCLSATAAPTSAGAQITMQLSSAANVQVQVLNLAGRPVALLPEQSLSPGLNTLYWNGLTTLGTKAPAGQYLVRVVARSAGGQQAQQLTGLRVP